MLVDLAHRTRQNYNGLWLSLVERSVRDRDQLVSNQSTDHFLIIGEFPPFLPQNIMFGTQVVKMRLVGIYKNVCILWVIYQHKLSVNFDRNFMKKATGKNVERKNAEARKINLQLNGFYPK